MQSVCVLLEPEYAERIVDLRAHMCEDPVIGGIYDPPFAHFTIQLAEEYDWEGLEAALAEFVRHIESFELVTSGVLAFTGSDTGITISPRKDRRLLEFHAALWETVTPFAAGRVVPFYHPDAWVPHVTIKRTGTDPRRFGAAMAKMGPVDVQWTTKVTNVAVQHDPGKNSLTHYLRVHLPLTGESAVPSRTTESNATIEGIDESSSAGDARLWTVRIQPDERASLTIKLGSPSMARLMAEARSSYVHFMGARCRVADGQISSIIAKPPFPVV